MMIRLYYKYYKYQQTLNISFCIKCISSNNISYKMAKNETNFSFNLKTNKQTNKMSIESSTMKQPEMI